jgi:hypoxanthine-guanine phosphoribosyltransferase
MYIYKYSQYLTDMGNIQLRIEQLISEGHNCHIIGLYRGSLPMTVHMSNVMNIDMSIIKFQSYGGKNDSQPEWLIDNSNPNDTLIILDDIYDSGNTIRAVRKFLKLHKSESKIECHVLVGGEQAKQNNVKFYTEYTGDWVVFPWEMNYNVVQTT